MEIDKLKKEVAYISDRNIKLVELYVEGETKDIWLGYRVKGKEWSAHEKGTIKVFTTIVRVIFITKLRLIIFIDFPYLF
jgi:hypothetical protein